MAPGARLRLLLLTAATRLRLCRAQGSESRKALPVRESSGPVESEANSDRIFFLSFHFFFYFLVSLKRCCNHAHLFLKISSYLDCMPQRSSFCCLFLFLFCFLLLTNFLFHYVFYSGIEIKDTDTDTETVKFLLFSFFPQLSGIVILFCIAIRKLVGGICLLRVHKTCYLMI